MIGFWIKGDWDSFKKFVDSNSSVARQSKVEERYYCRVKMKKSK